MFYADASELVAEFILGEHDCSSECLCWELRRVPAIEEALVKLGVPKFRNINEAADDLFHKLHGEKRS